jgi:hypothetical protein
MKPDTLEAPCDGCGHWMEMAGSCRERAVRFLADQRRLTEDLQPVVWRHQRDQTVNITTVDRVNETGYRRDWRQRSTHPPILADDRALKGERRLMEHRFPDRLFRQDRT